ncbi:MAG: PIN domain-containing protein [Betaproteobacteria bacterium]|nr:PIN domain-containing protein [Betaproteobacteria bacterium]MBA3774902.1 PIN domain-containing protein [Betaproteobacteria bacterium]
MILVDTSVWVDHLRRREQTLVAALDAGQVLMHPFIRGEVACGNLKHHIEVLALMRELPHAPVATEEEALDFIERRELMGRGIGYIDVHLLASAVLCGTARLWTRDKRLALVADDLALAFDKGAGLFAG